MKDELGGKIITEFVALRAKMYAYREMNDEESNRCKGTKKCTVAVGSRDSKLRRLQEMSF